MCKNSPENRFPQNSRIASPLLSHRPVQPSPPPISIFTIQNYPLIPDPPPHRLLIFIPLLPISQKQKTGHSGTIPVAHTIGIPIPSFAEHRSLPKNNLILKSKRKTKSGTPIAFLQTLPNHHLITPQTLSPHHLQPPLTNQKARYTSTFAPSFKITSNSSPNASFSVPSHHSAKRRLSIG